MCVRVCVRACERVGAMEWEQAERVRRGGEKGPRTGRTQGSYADPGDPWVSREGEKIRRE